MKNYNTNRSNRTLILFAFLLSILSSCSQDLSPEIDKSQRVKLSISVLGTETIETDDHSKELNPLARAGSSITGPILKTEEAMDYRIQVKNDDYKTTDKIRLQSSSKNKQVAKGSKAESLSTGTLFRILIYNMDGSLFHNISTTADNDLWIDVVKGESYRWIAYSYNRDNSVPLPDITDPSAPNISTGEGYDLLYATDTVHVSNSGVTPLGIVFKHKLSRIAVELNTMGMFADLNSAEITFAGNYFGKGTLDLFTGQITNTESYSSIPVDTSFQRVPGYEYGDRNVAYCYTSNPAAIDNFKVILNNFSIKIDDGSIRAFTTPVTLSPVNLAASALGVSRTIRVDLIESPLTVASVKWARQNLYYVEGHNPYRFNHTNAHFRKRTSYFGFRAHLDKAWAIRGQEVDPCSLVYPEGVWCTPSEADFVQLLLQNGSRGYVGGLGYYEYPASGKGAPYPSNKLRFNYNGQGVYMNKNDLTQVDLTNTHGNSANLWTREVILAIPPSINVGLRAYLSNSISNTLETELLSSSLETLNLFETEFKNVRCVRTAGN